MRKTMDTTKKILQAVAQLGTIGTDHVKISAQDKNCYDGQAVNHHE